MRETRPDCRPSLARCLSLAHSFFSFSRFRRRAKFSNGHPFEFCVHFFVHSPPTLRISHANTKKVAHSSPIIFQSNRLFYAIDNDERLTDFHCRLWLGRVWLRKSVDRSLYMRTQNGLVVFAQIWRAFGFTATMFFATRVSVRPSFSLRLGALLSIYAYARVLVPAILPSVPHTLAVNASIK